MIIDFHTHTFPAKIAAAALQSLSANSHMDPATDGTEEGLLASMREAEVGLSVILPPATSSGQVARINDSAAARGLNTAAARLRRAEDTFGADCGSGNVGQENERLLSFAAMHPDLENWEEELERICALGFAGIKLHPFYQETDQDDPKYIRIVKKADALGLITVTHAGDDVGKPGHCYCTPEMCRRVMDAAAPKRIVFAHMGGWHHWERSAELLSGTGCYIDTAFCIGSFSAWDDGFHTEASRRMLTPEEFLDMLRLYGTDRVLFGTDSPWAEQKQAVEWIRDLPASREIKDAVLGGNAERLLSMEGQTDPRAE